MRRSGAIVAAVVIVASSPFVGALQQALRAAFPDQFRFLVYGALALAAGGILTAAAVPLRHARPWRWAALATGVIGALFYAQLVASGNPDVDAVERIHFVEYGALAWLCYRVWRPLDNGLAPGWALLAGVATGIADEFVQWAIPARVGEIHDVLIDAVAIMCGLCIAVAVDPPSRLSLPMERTALRPFARAACVVILAGAGFFQVVHLGREVYEPDIGMFWSRFSPRALQALSADRAARWRTQPPIATSRLAFEDHYLSEGMWHVQARNLAASADDPFTAWRENRILETYFAPVIDTPSYLSPVPPRWSREQRNTTAERVAADPGIYISRAAPYPIYAWSPIVYWSFVAALIAAIVSAC